MQILIPQNATSVSTVKYSWTCRIEIFYFESPWLFCFKGSQIQILKTLKKSVQYLKHCIQVRYKKIKKIKLLK